MLLLLMILILILFKELCSHCSATKSTRQGQGNSLLKTMMMSMMILCEDGDDESDDENDDNGNDDDGSTNCRKCVNASSSLEKLNRHSLQQQQKRERTSNLFDLFLRSVKGMGKLKL